MCLTTIGMPLTDWRGAAMCVVGTREIIGEFTGNRHLIGRKGLRIKMQPAAWLKAPADLVLADAHAALQEISFQVLDLADIQRSQERLARAYQHHSHKNKN